MGPAGIQKRVHRELPRGGSWRRNLVAVDARPCGGPTTPAAKRSPLRAVTAVSAEGGVVLGQRGFFAGDGDCEITAAQALLARPDPRGGLVTGDAIHAQGRHGPDRCWTRAATTCCGPPQLQTHRHPQ
mgnify:CR=1 FL=1